MDTVMGTASTAVAATPTSAGPRRARLGVVTIGQTPRVDLTPELARLVPGVELVERGVLDGLSAAEIAGAAPAHDDHTLTTRLADGGSAVIGERAVMERLPALLAALEPEVDAVLLACTGPFPELARTTPLFVPDRIIAHAVAATAPSGRPVGVIAPLPAQIADTRRKFAAVLSADRPVLVAAASPYTGTAEDLRRAARELADQGAALLALDCFGYTAAMRAVVAEETGLPVIVARSIAARLAAEALGVEPTT
ncbi:AroM family protein [Brachybacterium huguangmaarense]|uniref:AroM family protein n=1 Tax=Brachybacterium huguangmaarense TaxID=1652028 RepID=A0ABY6G256_9MICO|nr:AroM family protein [Brachybacterium huguangmaarense]UYG16886.1 AroM family protein [Brachybacterium huguangmaarense]